ncbi:response regulator [Desulfovibrio litoralis]|uniref:histidine kinase n=1 Tax=Desulfovibrio litoralis DSM 11393 TaxID=1121455 RepID=A0A1M7THQ1_9BACT|nr:response regulator [Desulfovibrio litoralis]SHN70282.1 Signal transduction histidine kinase [Desulfovibrio litoralis DSM 11393]
MIPIQQSRLLLIHNDIDIRNQVQRILQDFDYTLRDADNLTDGLMICRDSKPDAVLLYIKSDSDSSVELLSLLTDELPYIPCIVLTYNNNVDFVLKLVKAGATDIIQMENFQGDDLVNSLYQQIKRYSSILKKNNELSQSSTLTVAENQVQLDQKHIEAVANAVREMFLSNVCHELRTPLNGILGLVDLMISGVRPESTVEYCLIIRHSALELLGSINKLIDIASLESNRMILHVGTFSLRNNLRDFLIAYLDQAQWKGLSLTYRVDVKVPDRLVGDIDRLKQTLDHLLNNAIKFTKEGRIELTISVASAPHIEDTPEINSYINSLHSPSFNRKDHVRSKVVLLFKIKDTGIGIPQEQLHDIFIPFTMGESFLTKSYRGLGLGLSIANSISKLMGGMLFADSTEGQGSCFTLVVSFFEEDNNQQDLENVVSYTGSQSPNPQNMPNLPNLPNQQGQRNTVVQKSMNQNVNQGFEQYAQQPPNNIQKRPSPVKIATEKNVQTPNFPASSNHFINLNNNSLTYGTLHSTQEEILRSLPQRTILLVEDDLVNRMLGTGFLESRGYKVVTAENGQEALDVIANQYIDLVLMDIQMPIMDGITATKIIRQKGGRYEQFPIIAITANVLNNDQDYYSNCGFTSYVSKPVNFPNLLDELKKMIS